MEKHEHGGGDDGCECGNEGGCGCGGSGGDGCGCGGRCSGACGRYSNYGCGGYGHWGGAHMLARWLLGIAILLIVFWIGVKVGEFKEMFDNDDYYGGMHSRMMQGYGLRDWDDGPVMMPYNMMRGFNIKVAPDASPGAVPETAQ